MKPNRAVIDCPVCFSGNTFYLESSTPPLICDDCGFALADSVERISDGICIFCESPEFYLEESLVASLFQPSIVCYVCESAYTGGAANAADQKYDEETAARIRDSKAAVKLMARIERDHQS